MERLWVDRIVGIKNGPKVPGAGCQVPGEVPRVPGAKGLSRRPASAKATAVRRPAYAKATAVRRSASREGGSIAKAEAPLNAE